MRVIVILCVAAAALALPVQNQVYTLSKGIESDGLWRTFSKAITGDAPALPFTADDALKQGWVAQDNGACHDKLGILYSQTPVGGSTAHPLSIYFTAAGQLAGVSVVVFGESSTSKVGDAAPKTLVESGYWRRVGSGKEWSMSVSFRDASVMCSKTVSPFAVGDRVVINQDTIAHSLPLTQIDAKAAGYTGGSCMKTMGQHFFLDLATSPVMSWNSSNLMPVVPMYNPPDSTGILNAFFFTTPVVQDGSFHSTGDWEMPFLPAAAMCQNWCDKSCHWDTKAWSTMHIYLNSDYKNITCPQGSGFVGRSCPV